MQQNEVITQGFPEVVVGRRPLQGVRGKIAPGTMLVPEDLGPRASKLVKEYLDACRVRHLKESGEWLAERLLEVGQLPTLPTAQQAVDDARVNLERAEVAAEKWSECFHSRTAPAYEQIGGKGPEDPVQLVPRADALQAMRNLSSARRALAKVLPTLEAVKCATAEALSRQKLRWAVAPGQTMRFGSSSSFPAGTEIDIFYRGISRDEMEPYVKLGIVLEKPGAPISRDAARKEGR